MLRVAEALAGDEFLVAEAGTGLGKSLAYLLPAVFWARATGCRVVVSTRTRALQEQLTRQDLPSLRQALPFAFQFEQAKGRDNYLCRERLRALLSRASEADPEVQAFLTRVAAWAASSPTGDRQELGLEGREASLWATVACDRRTCLRERCPSLQSCFRQRLARRLEQADIIVVNHALLLTTARLESGVLPAFRHLVIDEAHALEREAFDKFALGLEEAEVREFLNRLLAVQRRRATGLLATWQSRYPYLRAQLDVARDARERCAEALQELFAVLSAVARSGEGSASVRLARGAEDLPRVATALSRCQEPFERLAVALQDVARERDGDQEAGELQAAAETAREIAATVRELWERVDGGGGDEVVWVTRADGQARSLRASPLQTGMALEEALYRHLDCLVMVSATLSVNGDFSHFLQRHGLAGYEQDRRLSCIRRPSPFDYHLRRRVFVVSDVVSPNHAGFAAQVADLLVDLGQALAGNTLVLFTARGMLQQVGDAVRPRLERGGVRVLVQHEDGDAASLAEELRWGRRTMLMGLDTLWEGVDLPGEALTCLVMVRLPFRSPADPLVAAWDEHLRQEGENPFTRLLLPDAVLRFTQGMGRLIRAEDDWGAAVVLDARMSGGRGGQAYGRCFRDCLPAGQLEEVRREELVSRVRAWMERFAAAQA
jgi:ATP-dependent DNA helicase DinG